MGKYTKLENELKAKGVKRGCIRINESPQDSSFCILNYGEKVEVFYFERGLKFDLKSFKPEEEDKAIQYFSKWVLSIPSLQE